MATGITIVAEAVLEVASERMIAVAVNTATKPIGEWDGKAEASPRPNHSAKPVENIKSPSASPPPKSRTVPQSIRFASFQLRVNSWLAKLTGSTKRINPPSNATTASGKWRLNHEATGWSAPNKTAPKPGN